MVVSIADAMDYARGKDKDMVTVAEGQCGACFYTGGKHAPMCVNRHGLVDATYTRETLETALVKIRAIVRDRGEALKSQLTPIPFKAPSPALRQLLDAAHLASAPSDVRYLGCIEPGRTVAVPRIYLSVAEVEKRYGPAEVKQAYEAEFKEVEYCYRTEDNLVDCPRCGVVEKHKAGCHVPFAPSPCPGCGAVGQICFSYCSLMASKGWVCRDGTWELSPAARERMQPKPLKPSREFHAGDVELVDAAGFRIAKATSYGRRLVVSPYGHIYVEVMPGFWQLDETREARDAVFKLGLQPVTCSPGPPGATGSPGPGPCPQGGPTGSADPVTSSRSWERSRDTWAGNTPMTPSVKRVPDFEPKRAHAPFPSRGLKTTAWGGW